MRRVLATVLAPLLAPARAAIGLAALCALAPASAANAGMFLGDLLPSTVLVTPESLTEEPDRIAAPYVTLEGGSVTAAARDASVTTLPDKGGFLVGIDAITITPGLATAPKISASGVLLKLSGVPVYGADDLCAWIDRIEAVTIKGLKVEQSTDPAAGRTIVDAFDLRFQADAATGCTLSGLGSIGSLTANLAGGQTQKLSDLRAQVVLPASAAAAEARREASSLQISVGSSEFSRRDEIPTFGLAGATARVTAETATLSGLLQVIRATNPFVETRDGTFLSLQLANAATMIKAESGVSLPVIRVYAAGAVPARSVANFGRVGLSTVSAAARAALTLRGGDILGEVGVEARGIGDATAAFDVALYPYAREKLVIAATGQALGFHLLPDLEIRSGHVILKDTGLDRAVEGITGVPMGRYLEESAGDLMTRGGESGGPLSSILLQAGQVARRLAAGERIRLSMQPKGSVSVLDIILGVLRDPAALSVAMGATVNTVSE